MDNLAGAAVWSVRARCVDVNEWWTTGPGGPETESTFVRTVTHGDVSPSLFSRPHFEVEADVLVRAALLTVALLVPFHADAARYVVRAGDSLALVAQHYHISVLTLARLNAIRDVNLIQTGRVLFIPSRPHTVSYKVRWGDSLLGIAARYGITVATIRSMNPRLGAYPLAGEWLRLCSNCGSNRTGTPVQTAPTMATASTTYVVRPGDTLSDIATRYGTTPGALMTANRIVNADRIIIGTALIIPRSAGSVYDPWTARVLIVQYARRYGIDPALPLAVGWQESGFNQTVVSRTGAVGVMQVEPYTGRHISFLLGRRFNLRNMDDNIHAGVYWLSQLVAYYGGDERLAAAAYYEGTRNLAQRGFFDDTVQYVNNVLALRSQFSG